MVDVAVVGAGVSGLVCARDLHDAGYDVVVLEASDRLGGRVRTSREPGGEPVELGAQWVADGHHQLRALLTRHGLCLRRPPRLGRTVHVDATGRRVLPAWRASLGGLSILQALDLAAASARLTLLSRRVLTEADAEVSVAHWLAKACATPAARDLLGGELEVAACLPTTEVSLAWALDQVRRCDGLPALSDTEQQVVIGGLGALVDSLAGPLRIRTQQPAQHLHHSGELWHVMTPAGSVAAPHLVLATPPAFTDQLVCPTSKGRRRPGAVLKVVARYPRPFWREMGCSGVATNLSPTAVVTGTVDAGHCGSDSHGHLVGFVTGRAARRLAMRSTQDQHTAVLEDLLRLHGTPARRPVDLTVHDWSKETWTPGGYTWPAQPGARMGRHPPIRGLHFAGTEHADHWPGFVEGAVDAGHAVATAIATDH